MPYWLYFHTPLDQNRNLTGDKASQARFFFWREGAYIKQGARANPPPPPRWSRAPGSNEPSAAHSVEPKSVVRITVAVSPRPCLGCAKEAHEVQSAWTWTSKSIQGFGLGLEVQVQFGVGLWVGLGLRSPIFLSDFGLDLDFEVQLGLDLDLDFEFEDQLVLDLNLDLNFGAGTLVCSLAFGLCPPPAAAAAAAAASAATREAQTV
jgi:hypothetical protein